MAPTYDQISIGLIISQNAKYISLYSYEPAVMKMLLETLTEILPKGETMKKMEDLWKQTEIGDLASVGAAFRAMEEEASKGNWVIDEHDGPNWIAVHFGDIEKGKQVFDLLSAKLSKAGWNQTNESKNAEFWMKFFIKDKVH
jgi:hypothetical protein